MTYKIYAHEANGTPVPGATISVIGADGFTKSAAAADTSGLYVYDDSFSMALADGDTVTALADGYKPASVPYLAGSGRLDVIMEPVAKIDWVPVVIVGGLALGGAYLMGKQRKKVGAAEGGDGGAGFHWQSLIIPVAIIGGGYFLLRTITNTLGLTETADQKAQREASQNALLQTTNDVLKTQSPTLNDAELAALADRIYADLRSPSPLFNTNDADDVVFALGSVGNTADVLKLIQYFGTRSQTLFGIPGPGMTLPQFVRTASHGPDSDQIASLNAGYAAMGINWQW